MDTKQQILSEPYRFGPWQVTEVIDKFGQRKIQLRYFKKDKKGNPVFSKRCQQIYAEPKDWEKFKREIKTS
jgi:hypothetical protein